MQNSPVSPRSSVSPVVESATRISTCGCARPTVAVRWCSESSGNVCVDTGEVSVMP